MDISQGTNPEILEHRAGSRPSRWLISVAAGGFVLVAVFTGATFALLSRQFQAVAEERESVAYSQRVMNQMGSILLMLREAHAAKRAYVINGRDGFLAPYREAAAALPLRLQELDGLARDEASKRWTKQLQEDVQSQLRLIAQTIELYDREGAGAAALPGLLDLGRERVIATQDNLRSRRDYQNKLATDGIRRGSENLVSAKTLALSSLLVASLCLVLIGAWLVRQLRRHEHIEQRLKQASAIWRDTIDSVEQGIAVYDSSRRLMDWNLRYCELRGIAADKLFVGASIEHLHRHGIPASSDTPDSPAAQSERLRQVVEHHMGDVRDWKRVDGLIVQASARPMSGGLSVVTLSDVTAIRQSEVAARDQATRISAILDNVVDAILTLNESGGVESWSRGAERMFGYTAEEILHCNIGMLTPEVCTAAHDNGLARYIQSGGASTIGRRLELEARRKDGGFFPVDLSVSEMHLAGRRLIVGVVRDITERRALERMKTEFISTVSHELRTPLTSIAGSLGLVTAGVAGELPEKAARLLAIAKKNSERLTLLINDILDLEKSESGKIDLQLKVQPLEPIVAQAIEANRGFAESAGVRVELQATGTNTPVAADAERLVQVLTNLLSNAVKFSPPQGLVRVVMDASGPMLKVAVHDDGCGIAEAFRSRIFTRFAQADASDARHRSGTGLGLAIAKSLTENHGGSIDFASGQSAVGAGQGATFWIELPKAAAAGVSPQELATEEGGS